jgi:hypothetical protein
MARLIVILVLVSSCDSCLPEDFRATQKAGFERMAAARHQQCVWDHDCSHVKQCHDESEAFCLDAGYSKTCGNAEIEGSCGAHLR